MHPTIHRSILSIALLTPATMAQSQWGTYQANPAHDGYQPITIDATQLKLDWSVDLETNSGLHQVSPANSQVFVSGLSKKVWALDAATGKVQWTRAYTSVSSVNPPAFADGRVYVQTGNHSQDTFLRCFEAKSGNELFASPFGAQWQRYLAPTIHDGGVYINGGTYGGMYGFDAKTGRQLWFARLAQYDRWTPAVDNTHAYGFVGGTLTAVDRKTGTISYTIKDPNFSWHGWSADLAPVLGGKDDAFAVENGNLVRFDLANRKVHYSLLTGFAGQPAVAKGVVYVINAGALQARNQTDGKLLWAWEVTTQSISGEIAVTDSHVLVGSRTHTYLIDLATRQTVWSVQEAGWRSIGQGAIYIAGTRGKLSCHRFGSLPFVDTVTPAKQHFARKMGMVTIKGRAFAGPKQPTVTFDGIPATAIKVVDNETLTCVPPAHDPGLVDIVIGNSIGERTFGGAFTYSPATIATGDYRLGGYAVIRFECDPGAPIMAAVGLRSSTPITVPPLNGKLMLRDYLPLAFVPSAWTGSFELRLRIPTDAYLRGSNNAFQALVGPGVGHQQEPASFTNVQIVPVR